MKRTIIGATVALASVAVFGAASSIAPSTPASGAVEFVHAYWKDTYRTPRSMARNVDVVVVARAITTRPGRVVDNGNGDVLPFELTDFVVERALKGHAAPSITVERVGGTIDGRPIIFRADGGSYRAGATYLLFLNRGTAGTYYLVNDQGRYLIRGGLVPVHEGRIADRLAGKTVEEAAALLF